MDLKTTTVIEQLNTPWVEKYRPKNLDSVISHQSVIHILKKLVEKEQIPHLLLYGQSGTGKTSCVYAMCKEYYQNDLTMQYHILELNGSDDRGISTVREIIKEFCSTSTAKTKIVILDEVDSMTFAAQFALRRIIEQYTSTTRFCLIGNYVSKIIPALQSRCLVFHLSPLSNDAHKQFLNTIVDAEGLKMEPDTLETVLQIAKGDGRKSINLLQSLHMAFADKVITSELVYQLSGLPTESHMKQIVGLLNNQKMSFIQKKTQIKQIIDDNCLNFSDVINQLCRFVITRQTTIKRDFIPDILAKLSELYLRNSLSHSPEIHIANLVGVFTC
jgi:replication factor C subunit 3/5